MAFEHLIGHGQSFSGYDQANANLLAIGAVVARMTSLGLRITLRFSFEIRGGDVIEQEIILDVEERRIPLFEMLFNVVFVFE